MSFSKNKIAQVVVGLPIDGPFDYEVPPAFQEKIKKGMRVSVMFSHRRMTGYVIELKQSSAFQRKLSPVMAVLDDVPCVSDEAMALASAFSKYYGCSLGEAIEAYLPKNLRQTIYYSLPASAQSKNPVLEKSCATLIHDPVGEKRWGALAKVIDGALQQKQNVIFLVPVATDIPFVFSKLVQASSSAGSVSLTKEDIAVFDKEASGKKELELWQKVREGKYKVVLGTRSSIFAPLGVCSVIVIYDEENSAYKQEQTPHYHVHKVAWMRSEIENCRIVFVSAAPSAETWHEANREKWELIRFNESFCAKVQLVDMTNYNPQKTSIISFPLQNRIQKVLENRGKVILFMNRRGFSTMTRCNECGYTVKCDRCNVNLTYLYFKKVMSCPHCNFERELPKVCPSCQGAYLRSTGRGIEKLESEIHQYYPQVKIGHYDKDSAQLPKDADIIIATQAIFRFVEDFRVELAAVLHVDNELNRFDFRSAHHALAMMVQLKRMAKETLLLQTSLMQGYSLQAIQSDNWDVFYREELRLRKELGFPPFKHLLAVGLRGLDEQEVFKVSQELFTRFQKDKLKTIEVSDLHPDILPKLRDKYRYTIVLKAAKVEPILKFVKEILKDFKRKKNVLITINVDP
jgi:primosomal protein N' (replication factor Y)